MGIISTEDSQNKAKNLAIDWELALINSPIPEYLNKYDLLSLSATSKRARYEVYPYLFHKMRIISKMLYSKSNFFQNKNSFDFDSFSNSEKEELLIKYNNNKELAFKKTIVDPFVNQTANSLSRFSPSCKFLILDQLLKASYFLKPAIEQFLNLKRLHVYHCDFHLQLFNDMLSKLDKLKVLNLDNINLLKGTEDQGLANIIVFPSSLKSLNYGSVKLVVNDSPQLNTIEFAQNRIPRYDGSSLDLSPQNLPMLKLLTYTFESPSINFANFLKFNNQIVDLTLPITQLTPDTLPILSRMPNLKRLKADTKNTIYFVPNVDPYLYHLNQLNDLSLFVSTESDFALISQFIKLTPNLSRLDIRAINNTQFEDFNKLLNNLNYFDDNTQTYIGFNCIIKTYTK
jgi:hypothetical protein